MQIIRRPSRTRRALSVIINITAIMGYVVLIAVWIWWRWYTEGGPK